MTTLGPIFDKPLHVATWRRGLFSIDYRITNGYTGPDLINGGIHRAADAGNYNRLVAGSGQNRPVLAPLDCVARGLWHFDGALGVDFMVGPDLVLRLWHLSTTLPVDKPNGMTKHGPPQDVKAGQQVGLTGMTGLGTGAHTHIELWQGKQRIDPEPYLEMVEKPAIPLPEESMQITGANFRHISNRQARLTADSSFRTGPGTTYARIDVLKQGALFLPVASVDGEKVGTAADAAQWLVGVKTAGVEGNQLGYVHSSLFPRTPDGKGVALQPIEHGFTAEDMTNAKLAGRGEMKRECELAVARVQP